MFDKLLDLFRGQVKVAAIEGAEEGLDGHAERVKTETHLAVLAGLDEAGHAERVKSEIRQAVQEAIDEMSDMLSPKKAPKNRIAASLNGNGKRPHATSKK